MLLLGPERFSFFVQMTARVKNGAEEREDSSGTGVASRR